jgi:hypothetical protein
MPTLQSPQDAQEALRRILGATASGDITEALAQRMEAQVALFLKAYAQDVRDFDKEIAEAEARARERCRTCRQRRGR